MTDVLADRFAAVADLHDDSDWTALSRRRRWPIAATVVAAAVLATAALAGVGGWRFVHAGQDVNAFGTVVLNGHHYKVEVHIPRKRPMVVALVLRNGHDTLTLAGVGCRVLVQASTDRTKDGTVYFGFASELVRSVRVGGVTTKTVESGAHRTRVWALGVPGRPRRIEALDANGHVIGAKSPNSPPLPCRPPR